MKTSKEAARVMNDERFEVCVYVDGTMLFEDEDGVVPFNFRLEPGALNAGDHILSVMVMTTADHVGVASLPFTIPAPATQRKEP
jgi:hypothetical protein